MYWLNFCLYPARKHTGKVGPRAVKKSPVRKSNGHTSSSPSLKSSLTDNAIQDGTHTHTSLSKAENESLRSEKENEVDPEATSAQAVETAMATSMEADSTSRDDDDSGGQGPSSKIEETAATPTPTKPSSEEKERDDKDSKKTKQKIHPFFGMYSSLLYTLVYCSFSYKYSTVSYSTPLPKYAKFHNCNLCAEFIKFVVYFIAPRQKSEKEKCNKVDQEKW